MLKSVETDLPPIEAVEVASRVFHLPTAFHGRWRSDAKAYYQESVRDKAPYLSDNLNSVVPSNGLESIDQISEFTGTPVLVALTDADE